MDDRPGLPSDKDLAEAILGIQDRLLDMLKYIGSLQDVMKQHVDIMIELKAKVAALESERSTLKLRGLDETGL